MDLQVPASQLAVAAPYAICAHIVILATGRLVCVRERLVERLGLAAVAVIAAGGLDDHSVCVGGARHLRRFAGSTAATGVGRRRR